MKTHLLPCPESSLKPNTRIIVKAYRMHNMNEVHDYI